MAKPGSRITDEERKSIIGMYGNDMSMRDIAASLGRSYGSVHRVLADSGVQIKPRGGNRGPAESA